MKKILIIIGKLYIGGAERVARDIGVFADKSKYEIHYLVFESKIGPYEADVEAAGCRVIHMDNPSDGYGTYVRSLMRLIRRERYDVIHCHTMFNSGWAVLVGWLCGVPVRIAHSHSIRGFEKRSFLKNSYEKTMRRLILVFATDLVACGEKAGEWLYGKKAFDKRGILIYNGIDLQPFVFDEQKRTAVREQLDVVGGFVVGHAGHLAKVKNQEFLIRLLPDLLKEEHDTHLLLLGDGKDRSMLKELADELDVAEHVHFTGNVNTVGDYMSAMDVFAFPSLYEGTPLALIEAQANGLPCIVSEKIPTDAVLTDLVTRLPLEHEQWLAPLLNAKRTENCQSLEIIKEKGFDVRVMLDKIYRLYEGH